MVIFRKVYNSLRFGRLMIRTVDALVAQAELDNNQTNVSYDNKTLCTLDELKRLIISGARPLHMNGGQIGYEKMNGTCVYQVTHEGRLFVSTSEKPDEKLPILRIVQSEKPAVRLENRLPACNDVYRDFYAGYIDWSSGDDGPFGPNV